ncbi:aldose 1-epimerase family protein [Rhizobium sp. BK376]|uniref:aldose 1-epimerase family protein n=1 Tax=Rhizobium sp. BK376 TaxID=2512149 RepID=UPI001048C8E4|nr:aldose 1-epimerase family protein [Rhizobium sp. BK376]TCR71795.1 galactose mutarotase-like enzyme [Rhizobium sp. BK376]
MVKVHELRAGPMQARISDRGAELQDLRLDDWNLLWTPDISVWPETAPFLFPVVGRTSDDNIKVDGRAYPMPMHGFARASIFETIAKSQDSCTLELVSNAETRRHYPYEFVFRINYMLSETNLSIMAEIENSGAASMPFSLGFHPGFSWPLRRDQPKDGHVLIFSDDEWLDYTRPVNRQIGPDRHRLPLDEGALRLREQLFADGGLAFLNSRSRSLRFQTQDGSAGIKLDFPDMPQLILWMKPGSDFLCIEPCLGYADPVDFAGDFSQKPGVTIIAPNESKQLTIKMSSWLR